MADTDKVKQLGDRIAALEEALTHQGRTIDELSEQLHLAEQQRQTLARHHKALLQRVQEVEDANPASPNNAGSLQDDKPPHY